MLQVNSILWKSMVSCFFGAKEEIHFLVCSELLGLLFQKFPLGGFPEAIRT